MVLESLKENNLDQLEIKLREENKERLKFPFNFNYRAYDFPFL